MPGAVSLTGSDTAQIDGNVISTLADGIPFDVTFPNNLATLKAGKEGNSIFAKNEMGRIADVTLRLLLGGVDDTYLLGRMQQWIQSESTFELLTGVFVKHVGDGNGNVVSKVYQCSGGIFVKQQEVKTSAEGDSEQSVSVYMLQFANCQISIQ
jgi:hypothetical protein